MNILALDTSAKVVSVCVMRDGIVLAEQTENKGLTHSETLMPMVERTLEGAGCTLKQIDAFAAAAGPGSFTGLRIGVATVNALAHACGKRVIPVNTLKALAVNVMHSEGRIAAIMDARRHQVYAAVYTCDGKALCEALSPRAIAVSELCEELKRDASPVLFVGDGVAVSRDAISEQLGDAARFAFGHVCLQHASSVALCAWQMLNGGYEGVDRIEPEYLRLSQAERERDERLKREAQA